MSLSTLQELVSSLFPSLPFGLHSFLPLGLTVPSLRSAKVKEESGPRVKEIKKEK